MLRPIAAPATVAKGRCAPVSPRARAARRTIWCGSRSARTAWWYLTSPGVCPAGAWVSLARAAVETAVKRRAFARAFRREVTVDPALAETVDRLLERAALEGLSLANKGGAVLCGFTKVADAIASGRVVALIHAREAADDGVERLDRALRTSLSGYADPDGEIPILHLFTVEQLNLALGRANVIHAAVLAGPASSGFLARIKRLDQYRTGDPAAMVGRKLACDFRTRTG